MKTDSYYYVETAYNDGSDEPQPQFRAHVTRAFSPKEAEADAIADTQRAHPNATEIDFFLSRRITDAKAEKIMEQFGRGRWTGNDGFPFPRSD